MTSVAAFRVLTGSLELAWAASALSAVLEPRVGSGLGAAVRRLTLCGKQWRRASWVGRLRLRLMWPRRSPRRGLLFAVSLGSGARQQQLIGEQGSVASFCGGSAGAASEDAFQMGVAALRVFSQPQEPVEVRVVLGDDSQRGGPTSGAVGANSAGTRSRRRRPLPSRTRVRPAHRDPSRPPPPPPFRAHRRAHEDPQHPHRRPAPSKPTTGGGRHQFLFAEERDTPDCGRGVIGDARELASLSPRECGAATSTVHVSNIRVECGLWAHLERSSQRLWLII